MHQHHRPTRYLVGRHRTPRRLWIKLEDGARKTKHSTNTSRRLFRQFWITQDRMPSTNICEGCRQSCAIGVRRDIFQLLDCFIRFVSRNHHFEGCMSACPSFSRLTSSFILCSYDVQTEQRDSKDSLCHCQSETQSGEIKNPVHSTLDRFVLFIIICACHSSNVNISPGV